MLVPTMPIRSKPQPRATDGGARVEDGLTHGLDRAPEVRGDEKVRALKLGGPPLFVVGERQPEGVDAEPRERAAQRDVAVGSAFHCGSTSTARRGRVPFRWRLAFGRRAGKKRARAVLFSGEGVGRRSSKSAAVAVEPVVPDGGSAKNLRGGA